MIALNGRVKDCIYNVSKNVSTFKIEHEEVFVKCIMSGESFLYDGDIATFYGKYTDEGIFKVDISPIIAINPELGVYLNHFLTTRGYPLNILPYLVEHIETSMRSIRFRKYPKDIPAFLGKICESISDETGKFENDIIALCVNFRILSLPETFNYVKLMTSLLKWWNETMGERLLLALGVSKDTLKNMLSMNYTEAYRLCIDEKNPFRVPEIPYDVACKILKKNFDLEPDEDQQIYGKACRHILNRLRDNCWTSVPESDLKSEEYDTEEFKKYCVVVCDDFDNPEYYMRWSYNNEIYLYQRLEEMRNIQYSRDTFVSDRKCSDEQRDVISEAINNGVSCITGGGGVGKCLGKGTKVMLYNRSLKNVEDITTDDLLLGDDLKPRQVLSTTTGRDRMYKVTPLFGLPFVCNEPHVLTVIKDGEIKDIPLNEVLKMNTDDLRMFHVFSATYAQIDETIEMLENDSYELEDMIRRLCSMGVKCRVTNGKILYRHSDLTRLNREPIQTEFSIEYIGEDDYFGFELNSNGRFLLSDSLVTHNTTILKEIVKNLSANNVEYLVCSFTGKAVARVKEVLCMSHNIKTMHLAIAKSQTEATPAKTLILDEASMITSFLLVQLLKVYPTIEQIIIVGDINQLEPIGPGCFMKQMIESNAIPVYTLTKCYRSDSLDIVGFSNQICSKDRSGVVSIPPSSKSLKFFDISSNNGHNVMNDLIINLKSRDIDVETLQIVTPKRVDSEAFNEMIIDIYFKDAQMFVINKKRWFVGCRVMVIENNYAINVMNGESGIVVAVGSDHVIAKFGENCFPFMSKEFHQKYVNLKNKVRSINEEAEFQRMILNVKIIMESISEKNKSAWIDSDFQVSSIDTIDYSFSVTIHKSQGSEYKRVIVYIPNQGTGRTGFVTKRMIYTGVSRGQQSVFILCDKTHFQNCSINSGYRRREKLAERFGCIEESESDDEIGDFDDLDINDVDFGDISWD